MSKRGQEFESKVASELRKSGFPIKENVRIGKWEADLIMETPGKGAVVFEVKNRNVGIPDVLSVASMANNMSGSFTVTSGTILTTAIPTEPVLETAADNGIAVWPIIENENVTKTFTLLGRISEIELQLNRISNENNIHEFINGLALAKKLHNQNIIDDEIFSRIQTIVDVRNKIAHGQVLSNDDLDSAIDNCEKILKKLSH